MLSIQIRELACRGCRMCIDVCPTKVFEYDEARDEARVVLEQDCIGCLSCSYLCPSKAISHDGVPLVKNFYRDLEFVRRMERYL